LVGGGGGGGGGALVFFPPPPPPPPPPTPPPTRLSLNVGQDRDDSTRFTGIAISHVRLLRLLSSGGVTWLRC
jgi:hypothetical protein